jgi:hypothetical protein
VSDATTRPRPAQAFFELLCERAYLYGLAVSCEQLMQLLHPVEFIHVSSLTCVIAT